MQALWYKKKVVLGSGLCRLCDAKLAPEIFFTQALWYKVVLGNVLCKFCSIIFFVKFF